MRNQYYFQTSGQATIRELAEVWTDRTGDLVPRSVVFPDRSAPVIGVGDAGRGLAMMRRSMLAERMAA